MESIGKEEETMELPPGFRFHPTDEELISQYLSPKVTDGSFNAIAIAEADLNKSEPWDLPWKAKMGEREWYFFCVRDRKYPTGMRTNRATEAGYWKATGKDKEVYRGEVLVGMKKTLVFYKGRAPRGEKTDWVMHEYRLEAQFSQQSEWVICRVFQKCSGGRKTPISALAEAGGRGSHVTCFSGQAPGEHVTYIDNFNFNNTTTTSSSSSLILSKQSQQTIIAPSFQNNSFYAAPDLEYPESIFAQDQSALRMLCEDCNKNISGPNINMNMVMVGSSKDELSPGGMSTDISSVVSNLDMVHRSIEEDPDEPSTSGGLLDLDSFWTY